MKFTTLIPTTTKDGEAFAPSVLQRLTDALWRPCSRLPEAMKAVKRLGRKLGQRAMYFEVAGYDGVQILRID
jgi:hypothetical protein